MVPKKSMRCECGTWNKETSEKIITGGWGNGEKIKTTRMMLTPKYVKKLECSCGRGMRKKEGLIICPDCSFVWEIKRTEDGIFLLLSKDEEIKNLISRKQTSFEEIILRQNEQKFKCPFCGEEIEFNAKIMICSCRMFFTSLISGEKTKGGKNIHIQKQISPRGFLY